MLSPGPSAVLRRAAVPAACLLIFLLEMAGPPGISASPQTVTVRDSLRRPVTIPSRVQRILSLQPEITRIIVALGAGSRLVGLDYFIRGDDHIFPIVFPEGSGLPVVSKPDESVNRELVVRLRPDVIFASPTEQQVPDSIQRSLGIPVVADASMGRFERLLAEIELVGKVTGREERAAELVAYFKEKVREVARAVGALSEAERPRVYLAFWSSLLRTPVAYEPVDRAGGRNVAEGLLPSYLGTIGAVVNIEQIISWDPDILLVQGSFLPKDRQVTAEGVLRDGRLESIRAVRGRRVYYTFGFWYWWDPACVLVETLYLAKLFHPDRLAGVELETEGNAIFRRFYGMDGVFTRLAEALDFHDWNVR
jgi:iron complex transport system substrate-binding protein